MPKDLIHPSKQKWIDSGGDAELKALLPSLSTKEKNYLQQISSASYEELVRRIEKYTGIKVEGQNLPRLVELTFRALQKVIQIESENKKELENLALNFVFSLDEFRMVKEAVENEEVSFQLSLMKPTIQLSVKNEDSSGDLTGEEEMNFDLAKDLVGADKDALRKRLADLLIQGSAVQKLYAFHLVDKELSSIDPALINMYGILACAAQLGYWAAPEGVESKAAQGDEKVGAEQVVPEGEEYVIKVQAVCFPYLVHELVKGIYEWISIREEFSKVPSRGIGGETSDIIVGPEIVKSINKNIPANKQHLIPLINKILVDEDPENIKKILSGSVEGRDLLSEIIRDAEEQWKEYQQQKSEDEI